MKRCGGPCGLEKPLTDFYRRKASRDGYKSFCKECSKEARRKWEAGNKERAAHHNRKRYQKRREHYIEKSKQWAADNPVRRRELKRLVESARRARKRGQFVEHVDPPVVYAMHGGRCGICGLFIEGDFHVDHVIPLSKGGLHGYINVQPAHKHCNLSKGAKVM